MVLSGSAFGQACTNGVCAPTFKTTALKSVHGDGSAADGSWAILNHASDTGSSDLGCYASTQVGFALNALTITMVQGTPVCGQSDTTQGTQSYLTGSVVWNNLNYKPSEMSSGHVHIEVKGTMGRGWPAIWLLGGSGNNVSAAGCQYSSINHSWNNVDNCNWSTDSGGQDSGELDINEMTESGGYTNPTHNRFVNGGSDACGGPTVTDATTHSHLYAIDWTSTAVNMFVDGVNANCGYSSGNPVNPMFLLLENRVNVSGAPPGGAFPTTMTIEYVQVCDGSTCTVQNSPNGNSVFFDNFGSTTTPSPQVLVAPLRARNTWYSGFIACMSLSRSRRDYLRQLIFARRQTERRKIVTNRWHNRAGRRLLRELCGEQGHVMVKLESTV